MEYIAKIALVYQDIGRQLLTSRCDFSQIGRYAELNLSEQPENYVQRLSSFAGDHKQLS